MNECPYCQNTFEMTETCADEFRMWQGLQGPYYIPSVDSVGNISWTNTGDLPNPDPVNVTGKGLTIVGIVEDVSDLPESAEDFDVYLVGEEEPYDAYIWDGTAWVDLGPVGRGPQGPPGPAGPQVDPATAAPLMDGTAAVGTSVKYAREDHRHPADTSRASAQDLANKILKATSAVTPQTTQQTYSLTGLTADHELIRWNFVDSGTDVAENAPPCDLTWTTGANQWTLIGGSSTTVTCQPVFAIPE